MQNINSISLFDFLKKFGKKDLSELGLEYRCEDGNGRFSYVQGI